MMSRSASIDRPCLYVRMSAFLFMFFSTCWSPDSMPAKTATQPGEGRDVVALEQAPVDDAFVDVVVLDLPRRARERRAAVVGIDEVRHDAEIGIRRAQREHQARQRQLPLRVEDVDVRSHLAEK